MKAQIFLFICLITFNSFGMDGNGSLLKLVLPELKKEAWNATSQTAQVIKEGTQRHPYVAAATASSLAGWLLYRRHKIKPKDAETQTDSHDDSPIELSSQVASADTALQSLPLPPPTQSTKPARTIPTSSLFARAVVESPKTQELPDDSYAGVDNSSVSHFSIDQSLFAQQGSPNSSPSRMAVSPSENSRHKTLSELVTHYDSGVESHDDFRKGGAAGAEISEDRVAAEHVTFDPRAKQTDDHRIMRAPIQTRQALAPNFVLGDPKESIVIRQRRASNQQSMEQRVMQSVAKPQQFASAPAAAAGGGALVPSQRRSRDFRQAQSAPLQRTLSNPTPPLPEKITLGREGKEYTLTQKGSQIYLTRKGFSEPCQIVDMQNGQLNLSVQGRNFIIKRKQ